MLRALAFIAVAAWLVSLSVAPAMSGQTPSQPIAEHTGPLFETADGCMACHNGLVTPSGEDVSIGFSWRASMMANSARDPYWQASVRREVADHPQAGEAIEDECSKCHMPMARFQAHSNGEMGQVFAHLPIGAGAEDQDSLAADGVSCTLCHQITDQGLGTRDSFVGGFSVDTKQPSGDRPIYGPFEIDAGRTTIMRSATGFKQTEATHVQKAELCATCHTLYTHTLDPAGETVGELPEQMPYQEWLHSSFREEKSCQDCHMPEVQEPVQITAVLGDPRDGLSRHDFRGANFFMLQMLRRFGSELGVRALPQELELAALKTRQVLQTESARISIQNAEVRGGELRVDVLVQNLGGHKLPTAYPSRRAWLNLRVRDATGRVIFESGNAGTRGTVHGNDNDTDPTQYEPHYEEIRTPEQVQVYESIIVDPANKVTTGLLSGLRYIKDNRLLPRGFNKVTADPDIAVHGPAATDNNFEGGSDQVRYIVDAATGQAPFIVEASLWYQPIGYRWAENLRPYDAGETQRFVSYYESMASASGIVLAHSSTTVR